MVDAFDGQLVDASPAATTEVAALSSATTPADSAGLPQLDIPDQRIITEHLAAHIAKTSPGGEEMMVEQRLINELQGIHPTILSTEKSTAPTQNGDNDIAHQFLDPSPPSKAVPKKRKRAADTTSTAQLNGVVDPQLMQIDQAAALAAGDGDAKKRKRRAVPPGFTEGTEGGDNVDTESALKKAILVSASTVATAPIRKTTDVKARSWGATPVSSTGEPINGGTFSLEERFAIDKALLDYCEVHDMTMDQLKDRVWGNNRKKDEFWDSICSAVPNRSRASVYKHVRRSCHIFQQRAKWTPDEDAQLAVLVKEKGNKWKDIGEAMGRMGEDCRDRYRNYVKCGTDRGTDRWSEEEEELLKKVVREHKDLTRQILISQGKHLPPPDQEDAVLINWTTVSEKMENKRSRIQCRYKWKKMLAQKEKVKQAPIGVTYVGGKKKRISFDICNMKPGDKQWLLNQIRDSPATQENEIPWDQFAKNDKKIGIWTHKDLKSAYQGFRAHIPHKRRPLNEIIKQLLAELEQEYTPEQRKLRFVPSQNDDVREQSQHSTPDSSTAADNFDQHLFNMVSSTPAPAPTVAPVASMAFPQQQQQQQQQTNSMVDPELMGQGMHELEKMAGAAIAHTTAMQHSNEDLEEQELRTRLGGYISTIQEGGPG
ncbi:hypothetical protein FN846DRAFT_771934 [Sphaerosporella brunnea]|uniref:Homeodomain-like protein n=1 Tax=Sphaerosporella brunnea TaxID=1250544 RepID=A0A5J5F8M1_9PEZI|nr:hypothetical protein FN846DRAFT_771934 [Sphaerosporella brunnea]